MEGIEHINWVATSLKEKGGIEGDKEFIQINFIAQTKNDRKHFLQWLQVKLENDKIKSSYKYTEEQVGISIYKIKKLQGDVV